VSVLIAFLKLFEHLYVYINNSNKLKNSDMKTSQINLSKAAISGKSIIHYRNSKGVTFINYTSIVKQNLAKKLYDKYRDLQVPYATTEKQIVINRIVAMLDRTIEHKIEFIGLGVGGGKSVHNAYQA
jgi:hypothetical protein